MRDNGNRESKGGYSGGAGQIKPSDWTRTEFQVPAHEGYRPEQIHAREAGRVASDGSPTKRLAEPPKWTHRDDLPCTKVVPTAHGRDPFDTNDRKAAARLCAGCPAMQACLDDAMAQEDGLSPRSRYLIRGGLTPWARGERAMTSAHPDVTSE